MILREEGLTHRLSHEGYEEPGGLGIYLDPWERFNKIGYLASLAVCCLGSQLASAAYPNFADLTNVNSDASCYVQPARQGKPCQSINKI